VNPALETAFKRIRKSQPLNTIATSAIATAFALTGTSSEFVIKHLHRVGTVRRRMPNGRTLSLWSRGDDWVSNQIYWRGWDGYEPETVPVFFRLATRAAVTFDVGAYVGYYTLIAAHANPDGRVHAFEPMPGIHERLLSNIRLNDLKNVECVPSAVGDADGEAPFFHIEAKLPTSSSLSIEFMRPTPGLVSSTVSVITLDRYVTDRAIPRIDLLKIDTESTEWQVMRGMRNTIKRDHPDIFCEVLEGRAHTRTLEEMLGPLGYHYYLLTPAGPVKRDRIEGHAEWLNYLFSTANPPVVSVL
jgi:FkbM family methyltransferase